MAQQINRTLQDKINKLNDAELNELGSSLVGKKVFILDDEYFYVDTVLNYTISTFDWSPSNGNIKGDKGIVLELKRNFLNLLEVATEGDTLNVKSGDTFLQNTITLLNDEKIQFSGGRTFYFPISDALKDLIEPTLLDIGWLSRNSLPQMPTPQNITTPNVDVDTTPLNMEGDFIGEFVNKNATNLLELEKNNRPLFDVVEMTLNLLSSKFGKGESAAEMVDVVIDNADEIIKNVKGKDPNLIGLTKIVVVANDGSINLKGNVYQSWTEFNDALKPLYDDNKFVGKKVKFQAWFDDGKHIIERVDVGVNDFDPYAMKVGEYIDRPFGFFDNLDDDLDKYQWDDEIVVTESGDGEPTREDIENEINALNVALMYEDDDERINEINERINALNITLTLI
jgi:hypothetical protein